MLDPTLEVLCWHFGYVGSLAQVPWNPDLTVRICQHNPSRLGAYMPSENSIGSESRDQPSVPLAGAFGSGAGADSQDVRGRPGIA